jgi:serine/threonine protein kinase/Tol biopolymer transport system component
VTHPTLYVVRVSRLPVGRRASGFVLVGKGISTGAAVDRKHCAGKPQGSVPHGHSAHIIALPLALTPGTRLGVYEVVASIGAGGMGQVFRARDTKLDRDVAIKILPEAFAYDADRLARFQREAKTLASLNHPNIAAIYGLEESGGVTALVMELVEGDDLSQRIAPGAIPLDEALPIARQIAEALEAAHEQGIIHRDLKPANIRLRPDGTVKVLDFGLAKAMEPAGTVAPSASQSPTMTTPAMTQVGMILGTAAYMSPEQALGKSVDKRADVWAFGCVLFEMLAGRKAFAGETATDTLVAIIEREPPWTTLPSSVPASIRRLLQRCLEKDPKRRLRDIGDVHPELEESQGGAQPGLPIVPTQSRRRERLAWLSGLALMTLIAVVTIAWALRSAPTLPETRFEINTPQTRHLSMAIAPDGQTLAFVAASESGPRLWLRSMASGSAQPLAGTEGAASPFWSPDSRSLGFFAGDKLKRVDVAGADLIWFDRSGQETENAGYPVHSGWANPEMSPDGRHVAIWRSVSGNSDVWSFVLRRRALSRLTSDASPDNNPIWSPDGSRIVFSSNRKGVFDLYETSATGVGSEERLLTTGQLLAASDFSRDGRFLLYSSVDPKTRHDIWALPTGEGGKPFPVLQTSASEHHAQFSPDGKWLAYQSDESGRDEVYLQPFPGPGGRSPMSTNGGVQVRWRQDGKELFYIALDGQLMAVPVQLSADDGTVEAGAPAALFLTRVFAVQGINIRQQYMPSPDGQRFLIDSVTEPAQSPITVVLNWKPMP